mmetsp:Transcript_57713/g.160844  ORF Transcript_57713/g.160844 Transcript_57713/m.160844 type:complete len:303 (-) Transcript_57713:2138-3046(-)
MQVHGGGAGQSPVDPLSHGFLGAVRRKVHRRHLHASVRCGRIVGHARVDRGASASFVDDLNLKLPRCHGDRRESCAPRKEPQQVLYRKLRNIAPPPGDGLVSLVACRLLAPLVDERRGVQPLARDSVLDLLPREAPQQILWHYTAELGRDKVEVGLQVFSQRLPRDGLREGLDVRRGKRLAGAEALTLYLADLPREARLLHWSRQRHRPRVDAAFRPRLVPFVGWREVPRSARDMHLELPLHAGRREESATLSFEGHRCGIGPFAVERKHELARFDVDGKTNHIAPKPPPGPRRGRLSVVPL